MNFGNEIFPCVVSMVKVHYYGKQEVVVNCEYVVDYSTLKGVHLEKKFAFEKKVLLDENFDGSENSEMFVQLRQGVSEMVISNPKVFKVFGMRMSRCVVETHDLVVLCEETLGQGKYVEALFGGVENLPPPILQKFHRVFVEGAFARELRREMEKLQNVCIFPTSSTRLNQRHIFLANSQKNFDQDEKLAALPTGNKYTYGKEVEHQKAFAFDTQYPRSVHLVVGI